VHPQRTKSFAAQQQQEQQHVDARTYEYIVSKVKVALERGEQRSNSRTLFITVLAGAGKVAAVKDRGKIAAKGPLQ
jgi:hypothetical protein